MHDDVFINLDGENVPPQIKKARNAVINALSGGNIKRPNKCQLCSKKSKVSAHHHKGYDDNNLLSIKWLCRACHNIEDDKVRKKMKDKKKKYKKDSRFDHVVIIRDRDDFEGGSFEHKSEAEANMPKGVWTLIGKIKDSEETAIQSMEFSIWQWTINQVKDYLKKNDIEFKKIKQATEKVDTKEIYNVKKDSTIEAANRVDFVNGENFEWMISKFERNDEGFLSGQAVITNVGVFPYLMADGSIRRELRPPEEVFNPDSLESLKMVPLTNNHPAEPFVNSDNIKEVQVGNIGTNVLRDSYHISAPISVQQRDAVNAVESGKQALSAGYTTDVIIQGGTWMGVAYDAIQTNIRYNHVAIVDSGRAGDAAKIKMDSADVNNSSIGYQLKTNNEHKEDNQMLKKIKLDNGVEYEAEEKVIEEYTTAKNSLDTANGKIETLKKDNSTVTAERDTLQEDNKKLKADLEEAKKLDSKVVDSAVNARLALIANAKKADVELKNDMSEIDAKKSIILKAYPNATEKLDGADDIYVNARYDAAVEHFDAKLKDDIKNGKVNTDNKAKLTDDLSQTPKGDDTSDAHRDAMVKDLENAWKPKEDK